LEVPQPLTDRDEADVAIQREPVAREARGEQLGQ
jgi:hypothetical protein